MIKEKEYNTVYGEETINDINYKYKIDIITSNLLWKENRPYGLSSVYENMGEEVIEEIDIIELEPETDDKKVINKIKNSIRKSFDEK